MNGRSRPAWIAQVIMSGLLAINHVVVIVAVDDEDDLALAALVAINVLSTAILLGPYQRLQRWAWWGLWPQVAATASVLVWGDQPGLKAAYAVIALALAALQLATLPAFLRHRRLLPLMGRTG